MKKLFYLLVVAMCATLFTSCSKDETSSPLASEEEVLTIVVEDKTFSFQIESPQLGTIYIDWGDGKQSEYRGEKDDDMYFIEKEHTYAQKGKYTITVKNIDNIEMDMFYYDCTVISVDATKCPTTLVGFSDEDANKDGSKLNFNANGCTGLKSVELDVPINAISLNGCTSITRLEFYSSCSLTTLDISTCTALTQLDCDGNQLTSLDVSKNTALIELNCNSNKLTLLDVSKCTALIRLSCNYNKLTTLNVSKCTALNNLVCQNNNLTALDVNGCTALTYLDCGYNQLAELNVTKNTVLTSLTCDKNQLTVLDVSKNITLTDMFCRYNQLSTTALNRIFSDLPQGKGNSRIFCLENPGYDNCNKSIAGNKGWNVY